MGIICKDLSFKKLQEKEKPGKLNRKLYDNNNSGHQSKCCGSYLG